MIVRKQAKAQKAQAQAWLQRHRPCPACPEPRASLPTRAISTTGPMCRLTPPGWIPTFPTASRTPPSPPRNPGGTSGATRDEAAALSSTDTYHTSRASSPSPTRMPPARRFRDTLATNAAQTDPRPSTSRLSHGPTSSRDAQGHAAPTTTHISSHHHSSHSASASAPFASTSAAVTQPPAVTRVASVAPVSGAAAGTRLPQPAAANTPPRCRQHSSGCPSSLCRAAHRRAAHRRCGPGAGSPHAGVVCCYPRAPHRRLRQQVH